MMVASTSTPTLLQQERATPIPNTAYVCLLQSVRTQMEQQTTTIHAYAATQDVPHQLDITALPRLICVHLDHLVPQRMVQLRMRHLDASVVAQDVLRQVDITATYPITNVVHHPTLRGSQHAATPMVP